MPSPFSQILAIVIGYLLGSIPSAYIAARFRQGKDIRRLGGGNIGALNTFKEIGPAAGVLVFLVDAGKGAAAVAVAYWPFQLSPLFVMLTGLAAVVGHMWMLFLKFSGGRGMATAFAAVGTVMLIYDYWMGFLILLALVAIPLGITRNVAFSSAVGVVSLPIITWLTAHSATAIVLSVALGLLLGGKFLPTARRAWTASHTRKDFIFPKRDHPRKSRVTRR